MGEQQEGGIPGKQIAQPRPGNVKVGDRGWWAPALGEPKGICEWVEWGSVEKRLEQSMGIVGATVHIHSTS